MKAIKFINMRDGEITFNSYRFPDAECTTESDLYRRHANGSQATLTADIEINSVNYGMLDIFEK